jgi:hypothetical protein
MLLGVAKGSRRRNRSELQRHRRRTLFRPSFDAVASTTGGIDCVVECKGAHETGHTIDQISRILIAITEARSDECSISDEQILALP